MSDPNTGHRHRQYVMLGGGVATLLAVTAGGMFLFDASDAPTALGKKLQTVQISQPGSVSDKDEWRAQQAQKEKSNETMIGELRAAIKQQADEGKKITKELDEIKNARLPNAAALDRAMLGTALPTSQAQTTPAQYPTPVAGSQGQRTLMPPTLTQPGRSAANSPGGVRPALLLNQPIVPPGQSPLREVEIIAFNRTGSKPGAGNTPGSGDPVVLGFPVSEKARQYSTPRTEGGTGSDFITAGSFVRVAMLNGIDAPTGGQAQGNPLPVAFHVLDVANLPNQYKLDIKDCRIIGAAWGDLSSERTMIRTESMSCVLADGQSIEMQIKGQAIGEDGKAGLRSRLVSKQGAMLANALFGGALAGIGKAFQQAATTTTTSGLGTTQVVDPTQVARNALGGGVGTAGNLLAEYYLKAADKLFPVLETDGGRVIELLITKGVPYPGKTTPSTRPLLSRGMSTSGAPDDE